MSNYFDMHLLTCLFLCVCTALSRSLTVEIDQVVERIASVDARRRALKVNNFTNTRQMASLNALLLTSANLLDLRRADITYDVH